MLKVGELERMSAFLDLERAGVARGVYSAGQYAQQRREARKLGLAVSDPGDRPLEIDLSELLAPARVRGGQRRQTELSRPGSKRL